MIPARGPFDDHFMNRKLFPPIAASIDLAKASHIKTQTRDWGGPVIWDFVDLNQVFIQQPAAA